MPVNFLEDEAIADIAYIIQSETLESLFKEALMALFGLFTDVEDLADDLSFPIDIESKEPERLLHEVLDEVIYLKDAELFFPKDVKLEIFEKDGLWYIKGIFVGTEFDFDTHVRGNDVKAITWHDFYLKEIDHPKYKWEAYVLVDI